jgi:hypothetical protein
MKKNKQERRARIVEAIASILASVVKAVGLIKEKRRG